MKSLKPSSQIAEISFCIQTVKEFDGTVINTNSQEAILQDDSFPVQRSINQVEVFSDLSAIQ